MRTKDVRSMSQTVTRTIRLSPADNVVVAAPHCVRTPASRKKR